MKLLDRFWRVKVKGFPLVQIVLGLKLEASGKKKANVDLKRGPDEGGSR